MSSVYVREKIVQFLADNQDVHEESVIDLTGGYQDLKKMLSANSVQPDAPWLGLDFTGDEELPVSLAATNDQGLYREYGQIHLHVCAVAKIGIGANLTSRGETLRDLFRGRRIEDIVIESVSPINTGPGATLEFEAGYVSGTVNVSYYRDLNLGE